MAVKRQVLQKELENQERFSSILDRAEAFLNRLDQTEFVPTWEEAPPSAAQAPAAAAQRSAGGDVVIGADGQQYVAVPADGFSALHQHQADDIL